LGLDVMERFAAKGYGEQKTLTANLTS